MNASFNFARLKRRGSHLLDDCTKQLCCFLKSEIPGTGATLELDNVLNGSTMPEEAEI